MHSLDNARAGIRALHLTVTDTKSTKIPNQWRKGNHCKRASVRENRKDKKKCLEEEYKGDCRTDILRYNACRLNGHHTGRVMKEGMPEKDDQAKKGRHSKRVLGGPRSGKKKPPITRTR